PHTSYLLERARADLRIGRAFRDDARSNADRDHHDHRNAQLDPPATDRFSIQRDQQGLHAGEAIRRTWTEPALNRLLQPARNRMTVASHTRCGLSFHGSLW